MYSNFLKYYLVPCIWFFIGSSLNGSDNTVQSHVQIARIQYSGGGDWYNDASAIPNLGLFIEQVTNIDMAKDEAVVTLTDERLFSYPLLFMTGHGRIFFNEKESQHLRLYLENGGFLYADDDYGMDVHFRNSMKQVFPNKEWVELPFSHPVYHQHFTFPNGLPKIHEHDNNPPRGFGLFDDSGRLMVFYTYETNLSDGWADPEVHNNPQDKRDAALKMGVNIIIWALLN